MKTREEIKQFLDKQAHKAESKLPLSEQIANERKCLARFIRREEKKSKLQDLNESSQNNSQKKSQ